MKLPTKKIDELDFRQPHLKNVFVEVKNRLANEYDRHITAGAVNKAYRRGDSIVFDLVKEEVERCVIKYESEMQARNKTLQKKREFEKRISIRTSALEV